MKLKLIYFSEFVTSLSFYGKEKMDFFVFLFMSIIDSNQINKKDNITTILNDLYIPSEMHYLFTNVYYYLLDNNLVIGEEKDLFELRKEEIQLTFLGKTYFKENSVPEYLHTLEREVYFDPLNNKLLSKNEYENFDDIIVIDKIFTDEEIRVLINDQKYSLFSDIEENIFIEPQIKSINPLLIEIDLIKNDGGYYLQKVADKNNLLNQINNNLIKLNVEQNLEMKDSDCKPFTNNIFFDFVIGNVETLNIKSDFYFIINEEKKFQSSDNIIYLPKNIKDFLNKSQIYVFKDGFKSFNYKEETFENDYKLPLIQVVKDRVNGLNFKKYLIENKNKIDKDNIINQIIEML